MAKLKKGYIQIYTGDGKGKTTAALGLALRAAGFGLKVFIAQFIKGMQYSEIKALKKYSDNISVKQYGRGCFIMREPEKEDYSAAKNGFDEIKKIIKDGLYDIVILDEINIAVQLKLISIMDLIEIMENKPENIELILTGRGADEEIIKRADLVTEMREIKHYYRSGVLARTGIER